MTTDPTTAAAGLADILASREHQRTADPVTPDDPRLPANVRERLHLEPGGCWTWLGQRSSTDAPQIACGGRRKRGAKRVVWESIHGKIPRGTIIRHDCGSPGCISPNSGHMHPVGRGEPRGPYERKGIRLAEPQAIGMGIAAWRRDVEDEREERRLKMARLGDPLRFLVPLPPWP